MTLSTNGVCGSRTIGADVGRPSAELEIAVTLSPFMHRILSPVLHYDFVEGLCLLQARGSVRVRQASG